MVLRQSDDCANFRTVEDNCSTLLQSPSGETSSDNRDDETIHQGKIALEHRMVHSSKQPEHMIVQELHGKYALEHIGEQERMYVQERKFGQEHKREPGHKQQPVAHKREWSERKPALNS